jgi:hypothetical protein
VVLTELTWKQFFIAIPSLSLSLWSDDISFYRLWSWKESWKGGCGFGLSDKSFTRSLFYFLFFFFLFNPLNCLSLTFQRGYALKIVRWQRVWFFMWTTFYEVSSQRKI